MGWWHNLGNKVSGVAHSLSHKVKDVVRTGEKFVDKHAEQIADVAHKVGEVAGTVGNVAAAALPFTAEIPIVGEVVAGLAAGGKLLQKGAGMAEKGARGAKKASDFKKQIQRNRP